MLNDAVRKAAEARLTFDDEPAAFASLMAREANDREESTTKDNDDLALWDLSEIADAIAANRITSVEATEACLARIEVWQPRINAFLRIYKDKALAQAKAMDAELAAGKRRGPLHGVPMAHKDMYYRKGELSTGGSAIRKRLARAGDGDGAGEARCGGRGRAGLPQHGRVRRRPDRPQRASRPLPQSVGPDPRHRRQLERLGRLGRRAHGLWRAGLRHRRLDPPAGRGLRRGRHEGDLRPREPRRRRRALVEPRPCRPAHPHRARQCADAGASIAGHDPDDSTTSEKPVPDYEALLEGGVRGLRIGLALPKGLAPLDPQIGAAVQAAADTLGKLGAKITPVTLPDFTALYRSAEVMVKCEAAAMHRPWMEKTPSSTPTRCARAWRRASSSRRRSTSTRCACAPIS